jgi:hypothetical protein
MSADRLAAATDADTFVTVAPHWFLVNTGGVVMNGVFALATKRRTYQLLFWGAVATHAVEAVYTYRAAQRAGFTRSAPRWALQTLAVGFPSVVALHRAKR